MGDQQKNSHLKDLFERSFDLYLAKKSIENCRSFGSFVKRYKLNRFGDDGVFPQNEIELICDVIERKLKNIRLADELNPETLQSLSQTFFNLGFVNSRLGNGIVSLHYHLISLKLRRKLSATSEICKSLNSIGVVYSRLGLNERALKYFRMSLSKLKLLNENVNLNERAMYLNNVGIAQDNCGRSKAALGYKLESFKLRKFLFPGGHPLLAFSLESLATTYFKLGKYNKCCEYLDQALEMRASFKQADSSYVSWMLERLAICCELLEKYHKSCEYYLKCLSIRTRIVGGFDHGLVAATLFNLSVCWDKMGHGHLDSSLEFKLKSFEMYVRIYENRDHPKLTLLLLTIGHSYARLKYYPLALDFYMDSLEMLRRIYDQVHDEQAKSQISPWLDELTYCKKLLLDPECDPDLKTTYLVKIVTHILNNFPNLEDKLKHRFFELDHRKTTNFNRESEFYEKCVNNTSKMVDQLSRKFDEPSTAILLNNTGVALSNMKNYTKALDYLNNALLIKKIIV